MPHAGFRPRATIAGVPVHAMLVPFAVVCFVGALLADWTYANSPQPQWTNFAQWLLAFGEFFGAIAALFGLIDFFGNPSRERPTIGWLHGGGNAVVLVLGLINNFVHARDGYTSVVPTGLTLSVITVLILLVTGYLGMRLAHVHQRGHEARPEQGSAE